MAKKRKHNVNEKCLKCKMKQCSVCTISEIHNFCSCGRLKHFKSKGCRACFDKPAKGRDPSKLIKCNYSKRLLERRE